MSIFAVNHLCRELLRDHAFRAAMKTDPAKALEPLIAQATQEQLFRAGNVGGELLNWIAMLGAIGNHKPNYVAPQVPNGHAYGVWRW